MLNKTLEQFVSDLPGYYTLNEQQQKNASILLDISKKFLLRAKITPASQDELTGTTIILESGHQPNFLPHAGTWKKALLLAVLQKKLRENGNSSLAFFGFPDRNLSTARLLSRNQIPALNKKGVESIGFRISDDDRLKSFCRVKKPAFDSWQSEIQCIEKFYNEISTRFPERKNTVKPRLNRILEIIRESYELAGNFAELNAFIFAKICHELLDVNIQFFLYSDMQKERLFIEESKKILRDLPAYNRIYNQVIEEKRLDIPPVIASHVPFWYHCECGGKINLFLQDQHSCSGMCPLCKKEYSLFFDTDFNNLPEFYDTMDFNAVSRNIVMSEGLGDTLFLSGVGGSLRYGAIADQISKELKVHQPISLSWQSNDYYLGMTHAVALREIKKIFALPPRALLDPALNDIISRHRMKISQKMIEAQHNNEDLQVINSLAGMGNQARNWPVIARTIFSHTPSIIDIFVNNDSGLVNELWEEAIHDAPVTGTGSPYLMKADVNYSNDIIDDIKTAELPQLYQKIQTLEVE